RLGDGQAVDAELLHLLDELVRIGVGVLEVARHRLDLAVDEVPDERDHGPLVLVQLIHARLHARNRRSTPGTFSQVHSDGPVSRSTVQSSSLARSCSSVGGLAGDPGGNCWRTRRMVPSPRWTSASSSPSSSPSPPGSSLVSTRLTSRRAASRRTASSVKLAKPG